MTSTKSLATVKVNIRPIERYADPRECQIDITAPEVVVNDITFKGESTRVMPFADGAEEKFIKLLKKQTKMFDCLDASHFWVSGYYAVCFTLKSKNDRARVRKLVVQALKDCGGFMTKEDWLGVQPIRKNPRFVNAGGTGSAIRISGLVNPAYM